MNVRFRPETLLAASLLTALYACKTTQGQDASSGLAADASSKTETIWEPYAGATITIDGQAKELNPDRRPVKILTSEQAAPYVRGKGDVVVYNFRHQDRFWIANFQGLDAPVTDQSGVVEPYVEQLIIQVEHFSPAGHTELRFRLHPNAAKILLFKQEQSPPPGTTPAPVWEISDFVLSAEAVAPKGVKYDVIQGMKNHFLLAYTAQSMQTKGEYMLAQGHQVEQLPLDLGKFPGVKKNDDAKTFSAESMLKQMLIHEGLSRSDSLGLSHYYNTLSLSCVTEMWGLLDGILPEDSGWTAFARELNPVDAVLPLSVKTYLKGRGWVSSASMPDLSQVDLTYQRPNNPNKEGPGAAFVGAGNGP